MHKHLFALFAVAVLFFLSGCDRLREAAERERKDEKAEVVHDAKAFKPKLNNGETIIMTVTNDGETIRVFNYGEQPDSAKRTELPIPQVNSPSVNARAEVVIPDPLEDPSASKNATIVKPIFHYETQSDPRKRPANGSPLGISAPYQLEPSRECGPGGCRLIYPSNYVGIRGDGGPGK